MMPAREGMPLSPGELRVLRSYAELGACRWVATDLDLSERTVRSHLYNAYTKLGVGSSIDAFRALGWLSVPEAA